MRRSRAYFRSISLSFDLQFKMKNACLFLGVFVASFVFVFARNDKSVESTTANHVSLNPVQTALNINLQSKVANVLGADRRNDGIKVSAYFRDNIGKSVMVYDLVGVTSDKSRADVFRVFLDVAEAMGNERFTEVVLASRGDHKFKIDGDYFLQLGEERSWQNPAYVVRSFPENLKTLSGERAYSSWTGGVIGVLARQMQDFNDFSDKWWSDARSSSVDSSSARVAPARGSYTPAITKSKYDRLRNGMSYREVKRIVGEGEETARNHISGVRGVMDSVETVMYQWMNADGSNMNVMLQNDKLIQKAQFGLE